MAILIPEEVAASAGLAAWLVRAASRVGWLVSLANLLFGKRPTEPTVSNALGPFYQLMAAPLRIMDALFGATQHALETTYNTLARAQTYTVTHFAQAQHYTQHIYNLAVQYAQRAITAEAKTRSGADQFLRAYATAMRTDAISAAKTLVKGEAATRSAADQYVKAYGDARLKDEATVRARADGFLRDYATAMRSDAEAYADTVSTRAAARSSAKLSSDSALAVHPDYAGVQADLEAATAAAGAGMPGLVALIRQVPTTAPTTLPGAEAATAKLSRVMTRALADCVIPNCRNLSKVGRDLQDIFAAVEGVALLGFIAAAVHDPQGTASEAVSILTGPMNAAVGGLRTLIGD